MYSGMFVCFMITENRVVILTFRGLNFNSKRCPRNVNKSWSYEALTAAAYTTLHIFDIQVSCSIKYMSMTLELWIFGLTDMTIWLRYFHDFLRIRLSYWTYFNFQRTDYIQTDGTKYCCFLTVSIPNGICIWLQVSVNKPVASSLVVKRQRFWRIQRLEKKKLI